MAKFLALTSAAKDRHIVWVNVDLVESMRRVGPSHETTFSNAKPEHTLLQMLPGASTEPNCMGVMETPEYIVSRFLEASHVAG